MDLTSEQKAVVEISEGRHLVLAPPGSGKTEMLSQRILRALAHGMPPERMLCATFTNRAAFEMRERVTSETVGGLLPDVGNLHHLCERFLRKVGILHPGRRVIDEAEQRDMAWEVLGVLREELRQGLPSDLKKTRGIAVLAHQPNRTKEGVRRMHEDFEAFLARCRQNGTDASACAVSGMAVIHQRRIGIPRRLESPWPREANALWSMGALGLLEKAYRGLKRRFLSLDFDDLLNETYLRLVRSPLADRLEHDLRQLPWRCVKVSGSELGLFRPMRDFLAFVDLFAGRPSRIAWIALVRRFGVDVQSVCEARYFVRDMFASGWDPGNLMADENLIPALPVSGDRACRWAWRNRRTLRSLRHVLKPACDMSFGNRAGDETFHGLFTRFAGIALADVRRYAARELLPEAKIRTWQESSITYGEACSRARERIEKFLRYADHVLREDGRPFAEFLRMEWSKLRRLKEADLLVGDERIVVSTIHKAKGRQFDGVVIPEVSSFARDAETLRLLYVGMSRARRHLVLLGVKTGGPADDIAACFSPSYVGYYLRKAQGCDLTEDWLWQWERLAALNESCRWDADLVKRGLASDREPIVRAALRAARHWPDAAGRRDLYRVHLKNEDRLALVVDCLRAIGEYDLDVLEAVRKRTWGTRRTENWMSAMTYYRRGLTTGGDVGTLCAICLGDGLYSCAGEVRETAAEWLDEQGGGNRSSIGRGTPQDFVRLGLVHDPDHEDVIRGILERAPRSDGYAQSLRRILLARSVCPSRGRSGTGFRRWTSDGCAIMRPIPKVRRHEASEAGGG